MNILLLGKDGQVGWELQRSLAPLGKVTALGRESEGELSGSLDNLETLRRTLQTLRPQLIVNAAAYTAVDKAEQERELATRINSEAPALIAEEAARLGALLVHYSTDYVFSGQGEVPWQEDDQAAPLNHYGATKLAGERAIQESGCRHLIFRTSWVYGSRGRNFLATMQRLMAERSELAIVGDQIGAPTSAELIADVTAHCVSCVNHRPELVGLYHLAASGETSWYGFACQIKESLGKLAYPLAIHPEGLRQIPTADYPTPATRPLNSRLDTNKLRQAFGLELPVWRQGVVRALVERTQKD